LTASTSFDATWAWVKLIAASITGNVNNLLVDIAIGASGSEVTIATNLHYDNSGTQGGASSFLFPVCIPAGTRIAARAQSDLSTTSNGVYVDIQLFDSGFTSPIEGAGLDDIGTNTANSQLTALTTGTTGTKGSYLQLTASSARDYAGLLVVYATASSAIISLDVAVGAGGSEQIIIPDVLYSINNCLMTGIVFTPFFTPIPSGTRIAIRGSAGGGVSPSGSSAAVYGVYG
jgi:hypothetical protein